MGEKQVRRLSVVDRDKCLVGMVSLADLAMHAPAEKAAKPIRRLEGLG